MRLTHYHEGEKVSVEKVEQGRLVPGLHAHHCCHHVDQGDGLESKGKKKKKLAGGYTGRLKPHCE